MDVIVAMIVFQVGLLGVAGLGVLATRTLRLAEETTRAVVAMERVADSLATSLGVGGGRLQFDWGTIEWDRDAGGWIEIVASPHDTLRRPLAAATLFAPASPAEPLR